MLRSLVEAAQGANREAFQELVVLFQDMAQGYATPSSAIAKRRRMWRRTPSWMFSSTSTNSLLAGCP